MGEQTILSSTAADSSADYNQNGALDFHEFMNLVKTHELTLLYPNLNQMNGDAACIAAPRNVRRDVVQCGLEEYKCCPPPFIMPLLSLLEVFFLIGHISQLF